MLPFESPLLDELFEKNRQSKKDNGKVPYQIYVAIVGIELVLSSIFLNYAIYFSDFVHLDCYSYEVGLWTTVVFEAARKIIYCWSHVLYLNGSYNGSYKNNIYVATWFLMIFLTLPIHDRSLPNQIITYGGLAAVCRSFISVSLQMYVTEFQVLHPDEYCFMAHLGTALSFMILPLTAFLSHTYGPHLAQLIMSPIPGHTIAILHWMRKDLIRKELREFRRSLEKFLECYNSVEHDVSVVDASISTPDLFMSNPTAGSLKRKRRCITSSSEEEPRSRSALRRDPEPPKISPTGRRRSENVSSQANTSSSVEENTDGAHKIKVVVQLETNPAEYYRADTRSFTGTTSNTHQSSLLVEQQAHAKSEEDIVSSNEQVIPTPSDIGTSMGTSDLSLLCNSSDPRLSLGTNSLRQYLSVANSLHNLSLAERSDDSVFTNDEEAPDSLVPYDKDPTNGNAEPNAVITDVRKRYHQALKRLLASDNALAVPNTNLSDSSTSASRAETQQETGSETTSHDESSINVQLGESSISNDFESEQIASNEVNTTVRSVSGKLFTHWTNAPFFCGWYRIMYEKLKWSN